MKFGAKDSTRLAKSLANRNDSQYAIPIKIYGSTYCVYHSLHGNKRNRQGYTISNEGFDTLNIALDNLDI